jgi:hypothetical protein
MNLVKQGEQLVVVHVIIEFYLFMIRTYVLDGC